MANTKYTYTVSTDTANGIVDLSALTKEIQDSAIVTAIDYMSSAQDKLDVHMKATLSAEDESSLDSLVGLHTGEELPPEPIIAHIDTTYALNKPIIRAESRPDGTSACFTTKGDTSEEIGGGTRLEWDFSNTDHDVTPPANCKRKHVEITFIDEVYMKEGTIYFHNVPKGSYADFMVICPAGYPYKDNNDDIQIATEDTEIDHYVIEHPMQGSVPMGDELNTESANIDPIPAGYRMRLQITTPDSDSVSNGVVELELFRARSVIL